MVKDKHNDLFNGMGMTIDGIVHLSPAETFELCKTGALIVDIRENYEIAARCFAVKKILYIPHRSLSENYSGIPRDIPVILADCVGLRSKDHAIALKMKGYDNVANLIGGITEWEKDGLPLIIDRDEQYNGQCACMLTSKRGRVRFKK